MTPDLLKGTLFRSTIVHTYQMIVAHRNRPNFPNGFIEGNANSQAIKVLCWHAPDLPRIFYRRTSFLPLNNQTDLLPWPILTSAGPI